MASLTHAAHAHVRRAEPQEIAPTDEPSPLIVLGAGASFRSGVPTAAEAVKRIARQVFAERELKNARPPERVKPSKYESWL